MHVAKYLSPDILISAFTFCKANNWVPCAQKAIYRNNIRRVPASLGYEKCGLLFYYDIAMLTLHYYYFFNIDAIAFTMYNSFPFINLRLDKN